MSQKTAAREGSAVSGARLSASVSAVGADTSRSMPAMSPRLLRLAVIATAAGAFSGLFGVGGGTIIVPLLVLWFGYGEREATGTSLGGDRDHRRRWRRRSTAPTATSTWPRGS